MRERETISDVLRELIRRRGKTPKAVADETGVNQNTLYSILQRNATKVELRTLETLANYFGCDITVFLGLEGYKPRVELTGEEEALLAHYRALGPAKAMELMGLVANPPKPLEPEEKALLDRFRGFNDQGRDKVLEFCLDLEAGGRYRRKD